MNGWDQPTLATEAMRMQALNRLCLDELPQDPVLDGLVRVAAQVLRCPTACINLVGAESAWSLASHNTARLLLPREAAFCSTAVDQRALLEVPDLQRDTRFATNPLVTGAPGLRFYAGAPVGVDAHCLGTLCVLDTVPRSFSDDERQALQDLANAVTHWLVSRREHLALMQRDARHREHLEQQVAQRTAELAQAKAAAESANAAKTAFLATMSHEIRTPMNGVVGLIELLDHSGLTPDQKELTTTVRESADTLLALIDDVLDFSKIEAGHLALERAPLDLRRLIESAADAHLGTALARGVRMHVFVDPALPAMAMGDAVRLRQVVNNLLGNAVKFSGGRALRGEVSLRLLARSTDTMELQVRDNGVGIAADALARLFHPFEQAETQTTRRFGGTGLGLAICHRLVGAMNGSIHVHAAPAQGALFSVRLPLQAAPAPDRPALCPDLGGLRCTWQGLHTHGIDDWSAYLRAAGAAVAHEPQAGHGDGTDGTIVVRIEVDASARPLAPCTVVLRRGQRRSPQRDALGQVLLDADALHRDALVLAVAMAADQHAMPADAVALSGAGAHQPDPVPPITTAVLPVLVAEDNAVNRTVIARQLALLGVPATIVDRGDAALDLWRQRGGRFSLLLTDLHMPGLDGYALCQAIRGAEPPGRRLPVIALTANALRGEAERCLAAGMDDYLSKPLSLDRLSAALRRWLSMSAQQLAQAPAAPVARQADATDAPPDFDPLALERAVGPDAQTQAEVCRVYLASLQSSVAQMQHAAGDGDWAGLGQLAHRLKSSSRLMGALALGQLLDGLEQAGRRDQPERALALVQALSPMADAVREALRPLA